MSRGVDLREFWERVETGRERIERETTKRVSSLTRGKITVMRMLCKCTAHLTVMSSGIIECSGEGTMLRRAGSAYIGGRNHSLIKLKVPLSNLLSPFFLLSSLSSHPLIFWPSYLSFMNFMQTSNGDSEGLVLEVDVGNSILLKL